ncbi:MAG: dephospho-CoA kinase [Candidatus Promineifilaceae bacterium]|nr:dephospho-CoA kinase [Candidatus Promineifilaceae bacterium]
MEPSKPRKDKFVIGLTGNIATGKSTVMALAAQRGALTIDADELVHEILNHDTAVQDAIAAVFGAGVRHADGKINRPALGKIVFNNPQTLRQLERIVHPAVYTLFAQRIRETEAQIVMYEAIKLLEGKLRESCDQIWVTTCTRERQLQRLQRYRHMDETTALSRIDAQAPQEEKIAQANVVIDTNGTMQETEQQFEQAWSQVEKPHND